ELVLHEPGFVYSDLYVPDRLVELSRRFDAFFRDADAEGYAKFDAYRACKGKDARPEQVSEALLVAAPHLSRFVVRLFGVEADAARLVRQAKERSSLWHFKREFAKKRLFKPNAGKTWEGSPREADATAKRSLAALGAPMELLDTGTYDEELAVARAVLLL